jgi:hypothetical protein
MIGTSNKVYVAELDSNSTSIEDMNEQFRSVSGPLRLVSMYETLPTRVSPGIKKLVNYSHFLIVDSKLLSHLSDCRKRHWHPELPQGGLRSSRCGPPYHLQVPQSGRRQLHLIHHTSKADLAGPRASS